METVFGPYCQIFVEVQFPEEINLLEAREPHNYDLCLIVSNL